VYYVEYFSPDYTTEIDENLAAKDREYSSMCFPSFSESKPDFVCFFYKVDVEDISVLEANILGIPTYEEEVISDTVQEKTTCNGYPIKEDEEQELSHGSCLL
jgi:hypothetical protein